MELHSIVRPRLVSTQLATVALPELMQWAEHFTAPVVLATTTTELAGFTPAQAADTRRVSL